MDKWFYAWMHLQEEMREKQPHADAISTSDDLVALLARLIYPAKVKADGKFDRTVKHVDLALECIDTIIANIEPMSSDCLFCLGYKAALLSLQCVLQDIKKGR